MAQSKTNDEGEVILKLSQQEVTLLLMLLGEVGGNPRACRGILDDIFGALDAYSGHGPADYMSLNDDEWDEVMKLKETIFENEGRVNMRDHYKAREALEQATEIVFKNLNDRFV